MGKNSGSSPSKSGYKVQRKTETKKEDRTFIIIERISLQSSSKNTGQ